MDKIIYMRRQFSRMEMDTGVIRSYLRVCFLTILTMNRRFITICTELNVVKRTQDLSELNKLVIYGLLRIQKIMNSWGAHMVKVRIKR